MTVTEELRRMLDECGVEYEVDDTQISETEWYCVTKLRDGYHDRWTYEEPPDSDLLVSYQYDLGAEDAIAATLGRGTCIADETDTWECVCDGLGRYGERVTIHVMECSACGRTFEYINGSYEYCPYCRAKIKEN